MTNKELAEIKLHLSSSNQSPYMLGFRMIYRFCAPGFESYNITDPFGTGGNRSFATIEELIQYLKTEILQ